jgi:hypothetical protein
MAKKVKLANKQALDTKVAKCSNGITSFNYAKDK